MKQGIDYGFGMSNNDHKTGIRYGVISQHEVLQAWADSSEAYYGKCYDCNEEIEECTCDDVEEKMEFAEPSSFYIDDGEYSAECSEDGDIFITKSPYYTECQFCSPCAPGAGYLMNSVKGGVKAYCFGNDWFESGKAPYPVYSVKTGKLVLS